MLGCAHFQTTESGFELPYKIDQIDPYILVPQCLHNKNVMIVNIVQMHRSWVSVYMGINAPGK